MVPYVIYVHSNVNSEFQHVKKIRGNCVHSGTDCSLTTLLYDTRVSENEWNSRWHGGIKSVINL